MAESSISFLLDQLSTLLKEEGVLLGELGQEVRFIRGELDQMRAFLRVADSRGSNSYEKLLMTLKMFLIDTCFNFTTVMHMHGFRGFLKKSYASVKNLKARHEIASEIKAIKSKLENASKSHKTFEEKYSITHLESSSKHSTTTSYDDGRGDALLLEDIDVVGIEEPKQQLLEWISSVESGLKVISVVGMAGLGKTTLVKKVYETSSVKNNFDHHAWITVSESFQVEIILEDIIKQLVQEVKQPPPPELGDMNDNDKKKFIYNFLQNKNYIIVLDDVWRTNAWEAVRHVFPKGTANSRGCIIITSRLSSIGNAACSETNGHIYTLKHLSEEESRSLFYKKAFSGSSCPPYLTEIIEKLLTRFEGWPLAIVVIGGVLATKNNKFEEWERFLCGLGSELEGDDLTRMSKLLSLSFYDLPYYLKTCLLYLSIFSEDQVIQKATIIRLWIAEGFVEAKQGKTMDEIAEGYLNELVNRSLIQVVQIDLDGRSRNFRIHDLVQEYVIAKARDQDMAVVYNIGEIEWVDRIRRLAIHSSISCTLQCYKFEHLHSLLFLGEVDSDWLPMLFKILCGGCRMLKVLDLRGSPLDTIPNEVFKLYHLKYLSLRNTQVKVIPKAIGNLGRLETLDLKKSMVTELPIEILKLQRLRNLLVYWYKDREHLYSPFDCVQSFKAPNEMGRLASLQKLCYIDADNLTIVREIGKVTQLQRLGITKLRSEDGMEFCCSLAKLTSLRSLVIQSSAEGELLDLDYTVSPCTFPFLRTLELSGYLEKISQWIPCLSALTIINLRCNRLREDPLESLQGLPNLRLLEMCCAYEGQRLNFKAGGFQNLKELYLIGLRELRWVRVEKGSMPILREFNIFDCKLMVELPVGIEHLTNLQDLNFLDMSKEFVVRMFEIREQGEQWKLAHIPEVTVIRWNKNLE